MKLGFVASAVSLVVWACGTAAAQDAALGDFAGQWVGKVTVETMGPTDFPTSVREAGVTITPDAEGGFVLEWSTVTRESGDAGSPEETVHETEIAFKKAGGDKRWSAADPGDPAGGKPAWHARLSGNTLTVTGFALLEDGQAELQTYRRTLEGGVLGLSYTRIVDGDLRRRASGALTRFAQ